MKLLCIVGEFGAQLSQDMLWANRRYQCTRGGCVPLSGLTDQNFDLPGIQNLRTRQLLDKMSELILLDFGVDRG